MQVTEIKVGDSIRFSKCGECTGKTRCFFCKPGVKNIGVVVATYRDSNIPTVEVKVKGSDVTLEITQADLEDPELVEGVILK